MDYQYIYETRYIRNVAIVLIIYLFMNIIGFFHSFFFGTVFLVIFGYIMNLIVQLFILIAIRSQFSKNILKILLSAIVGIFSISFGLSLFNIFYIKSRVNLLLLISIFAILEICINLAILYYIKELKKVIVIKISGEYLRKFEDNQLILEASKDQIDMIYSKYHHYKSAEINTTYKEIVVLLKNNKKIKICSDEKKKISEIDDFLPFLYEYCKKYNIKFQEY